MKNKTQDQQALEIRKVEMPWPSTSLSRLGAGRAENLKRLGVRNLRELLAYEPVRSARLLAAVSRGLIHDPQLTALVKKEFAKKDAVEAVGWPVSALHDIGDGALQTLAAMGVKTIGDLAQLAREADEVLLASLEDNGFRERPSAPAQLLPGVIGSVASAVRYATFVRDVELRALTFKVNDDCIVPLPISSDGKQKISLAEMFQTQKCPVVYLGYMCDHRQRWTNLGTHLGEVVHSLSLAPGESRNIALVNWRRRQLTALEERTTTRERMTATFVQNRAIEEITSAVASEHQRGGTQTEANTAATAASFVAAGAAIGGGAGALIGTLVEPGGGTALGAALGAGAGVIAGGLVYAGSQAFGVIEADSSGDRRIIADLHQRIALSTSQTASTVRSLWSTAVVEDAQAESVNATTSNITNYNHMHALNIEYYEALQRYLVQIDLEGVQPILFLPFTFLDFTNFRFVRDYWEAIRPHIDDEGLQAQGDSFFVTEEAPKAPDRLPVPDKPTLEVDSRPLTLKSLVIDVLFKSVPFNTDVGLTVLRGNQEIHGRQEPDKVQDTLLDGYDFGNRYSFGDIEDPQEITEVSLSRDQSVGMAMPFRIRVAGGRLHRGDSQLDNLSGEIIASNRIFAANAPPTRTIAWSPAAGYESADALARDEYNKALRERSLIIAKNRSRVSAYEALVADLERFKRRLQNLILRRRHYFTRVILNAMEPEEIAQLLESLLIACPGENGQTIDIPLSSIAHTIPLGLTAGAFVLKLKRLNESLFSPHISASLLRMEQPGRNGELKIIKTAAKGKLATKKPGQKDKSKVEGPDRKRTIEALKTLLQYYNRTLSFFEEAKAEGKFSQTDQVYTPTGGLFAEAILGRANSAEYLDLERYFNWQDSPIPHQPPAIQPVGTESRFQSGDVNVHLPEGNLQVINPVALPDPTGLQGALAAIQNANLFRDMSKASELTGVINGLSALAGQIGQAATGMTGQSAQQALQAATEVGKAAAGLAQAFANSRPAQDGSLSSQGALLNQAKKIDEKKAIDGDGGAVLLEEEAIRRLISPGTLSLNGSNAPASPTDSSAATRPVTEVQVDAASILQGLQHQSEEAGSFAAFREQVENFVGSGDVSRVVADTLLGNARTRIHTPFPAGDVGSRWGQRVHPISGVRTFHQGVDFPKPVGSPVLAVASGTAARSYRSDSFGETVILDHGFDLNGNRYYTLYAHNSLRRCQTGDAIVRDAQIADSGNTGNSTGPHVHFEVRVIPPGGPGPNQQAFFRQEFSRDPLDHIWPDLV